MVTNLYGENPGWYEVYQEMLTTHIPALEKKYEGTLPEAGLKAIQSQLIKVAKRKDVSDVQAAIEDIVGEYLED